MLHLNFYSPDDDQYALVIRFLWVFTLIYRIRFLERPRLIVQGGLMVNSHLLWGICTHRGKRGVECIHRL